MQNICNSNGCNRVHISDIFNCYRENINGMWNPRRNLQNIWIYTNLKHKYYMCKYRVKQDLILNSSKVRVSINKNLVTKFVTVKVSQNLNLMQSLSTQWNQQLIRYVFSRVIECLEQKFQNKLIAKDHRIPDKWSEYRIFILKCRNIKLWNVLKYNQVKLVLAVFAFIYSTLNHIDQARWN